MLELKMSLKRSFIGSYFDNSMNGLLVLRNLHPITLIIIIINENKPVILKPQKKIFKTSAILMAG